MTESGYWRIDEILGAAWSEGRDTLLESEAYQLLDEIGIEHPRFVFVPQEEALSGQAVLDLSCLHSAMVVAKVVSADIFHKTDVGGLKFVPKDPARVRSTVSQMVRTVGELVPSARIAGVVICERIDYPEQFGRELLMSFRQDDAFGPVISFGLGGVDTERFARWMRQGKGVASRASLLADEAQLADLVRSTAAGEKLLSPPRGSTEPLLPIERIVAALNSLAELSKAYSILDQGRPWTIEQLELNPVVVTEQGELVAVDALVKFSQRKVIATPRPIQKLKRLLEPRSALVVGVSASSSNVGRIILRNLIEGGGVPKERIYILHPRESQIDGCRCFASIDQIPEQVDMAVVTIPASEAAVNLMIEMIKKRKTQSITLIASGYAETKEGKSLEERLKKAINESHLAEDGGVIVNGGNCLGIVSQPGRYNTFFLPKYKLAFGDAEAQNVGCISQSGAYLVTQASNLDGIINPRYAVSFGNQIDLTAGDYLEYLSEDSRLDLYSVYLEGFKPLDGMRFTRACRRITAGGRHVLIYKAGRSKEGAMAAASHTAAMVGDYALNRDVLTQAGAIVAETLDEFADYLQTFTLLSGKTVEGTKVGIISNAGFECTAAADSLFELRLAELAPSTLSRLEEILPSGIVEVKNPIDVTPITDTARFEMVCRALLADAAVQCAVISIVCPTPYLENLEKGPGHSEDITHETSLPNRLIRVFRDSAKPVVFSVDSGPLYDPFVRMMQVAGLPCFRKIDRATRALSKFVTARMKRS